MGLRVFLDEITDLNAAQSDNIQKFHNLLAISQMNTRKKFRSFQLLPRETDRQQNWHFCWSLDKNLTGYGLPLCNSNFISIQRQHARGPVHREV